MEASLLWSQYISDPSAELKKKLVLQYIKLVHYVIHNSKFVDFNILDDRDYFQFGIEGLSEAVDRFDPNYGTKFETYAIQRIRGKIIDELRKISIKPRVQTEDDVQYVNVSINSPVNDEDNFLLYEILPDDNEKPNEIAEKEEAKELLINAIQKLEERDRMIITLYYYENLNYKEIAKLLKITVSRVSQVHTRILSNLKNNLHCLNER